MEFLDVYLYKYLYVNYDILFIIFLMYKHKLIYSRARFYC